MKICLYTMVINEEEVLPFFLDYYTNYVGVNKIVVYDGGSTDRSHEIINSYPNTQIVFEHDEKTDSFRDLRIWNDEWKKDRNDYDWMIVCTPDEFLYHPDLKNKLLEYKNKNITIPKIEGFDMISLKFPSYDKGNFLPYQINRGIKDQTWLNKNIIFNPKEIDINYHVGCHNCSPVGNVKYSDDYDFKLLHFKWLSYDFLIRDAKRKFDRLSSKMLETGAGFHYKIFSQYSYDEYVLKYKETTQVVDNHVKISDDLLFNITMDYYSNIIYIKSLNDFYDNVTVNIKNGNNIIYLTNSHFQKNITYWYRPDTLFSSCNNITVQILNKENLIIENKFRIKDNYNNIIRPIALCCNKRVGIGDFMMSIPLIRKLCQIYEQKIIIIGHSNIQDITNNLKYVNRFININDVNMNEFEKEYEVFHIYDDVNVWSILDHRKLLTRKLNLNDDEFDFEFLPDKYNLIENLPEKYICINPNDTGEERGWNKNNWQELVDGLNDNNIPVVSIGKYNYFNLNIKIGLDLAGKECQNNLSQAWHIINKSNMFVTFTSGLFILSQTTGTHIIELATYMNPYLQKSKRLGEYHFIIGECSEFCRTNLKYNINEYGTIKKIGNQECKCMLNIGYVCKPSPKKVIKEILKLWK